MSVLRHTALFSDLSATLLEAGHAVRFCAEGQSMRPAIRHGDLVTVKPVPPAGPRCGDVVLYMSQRGPVLHRVVAVIDALNGKKEYKIQGDALRCSDALVVQEQVLGRVVKTERAGLLRRVRRFREGLQRRVLRAGQAFLPHTKRLPPAFHRSG